MGLCRERVAKQAQKQVAFLVEASIICSNVNYNLEPRFAPENFTEYHNQLCAELLEISKNYRSYKSTGKKRQSQHTPTPKKKRSHRSKLMSGSNKKKRKRGVCPGTVTDVGLKCRARYDLLRNMRFSPTEGTLDMQRKKCAFCGKSRTIYTCKLCDAHLCMRPPVHILIPGSNPPRHYRTDGLWCVHLWHGLTKLTDMDQ